MTRRRARERSRLLWDPGAQPERTHQAWTRTALACVVCALLLVRLSGRVGGVALVPAAVVLLGVAGLVVRQQRRLVAGSLAVAPWPLAGLTALTLVLAVSGVALVLVGR